MFLQPSLGRGQIVSLLEVEEPHTYSGRGEYAKEGWEKLHVLMFISYCKCAPQASGTVVDGCLKAAWLPSMIPQLSLLQWVAEEFHM